ncbi:MAG: hypothetical protein AAF821_08060 [Cyanobacteria bacterium P01_D01_bin.156]
MQQKICLADLEEKFLDLDTPEAELANYFVGSPEDSGPFAPALRINEELVDFSESEKIRLRSAGFFDFLNQQARKRRTKRFERRQRDTSKRPILISEGDSWFQFPVLLDDVIDNLSEKRNPAYRFNIFSLGKAGDTTRNMICQNPEFLTGLNQVRDMGLAPAGLVFSGGGNDILGADEGGLPVFNKILFSNLDNPSIDNVFREDEIQKIFNFLKNAYETLFQTVHAEYPGLPIFIHGYDYVYPGKFGESDNRKRTLYARRNQWIGKPMDELGITDKTLQRLITKRLLDRFNILQKSLVESFDDVYLIETLGTLDQFNKIDEWNDEIHPNNSGFTRIAQKFFDKIGTVILDL